MSKFQARHYVAVARVLNEAMKDAQEYFNAGAIDTLTNVTDRFSRVFHDDSPGFDNVRFHDAVHKGKGL